MRALRVVAAVIGLAILIFAHTSLVGIMIGIAFLGLAVAVPEAARSQNRSE